MPTLPGAMLGAVRGGDLRPHGASGLGTEKAAPDGFSDHYV